MKFIITQTPARQPKQRGSILLEVIVVLVLIAIMGMYIYPNIPFIKRNSETNGMKAKACQLETAMNSYVSDMSVRAALSSWSGMNNDQRFTAISPYLQYPVNNLSNFVVKGFSITFPSDPRQQVQLRDPDNNLVEHGN